MRRLIWSRSASTQVPSGISAGGDIGVLPFGVRRRRTVGGTTNEEVRSRRPARLARHRSSPRVAEVALAVFGRWAVRVVVTPRSGSAR